MSLKPTTALTHCCAILPHPTTCAVEVHPPGFRLRSVLIAMCGLKISYIGPGATTIRAHALNHAQALKP